MHFLYHLLNRMLPLQTMVFGQNEEIPAGFDRVITNTNDFVVTNTGNFVIAKP